MIAALLTPLLVGVANVAEFTPHPGSQSFTVATEESNWSYSRGFYLPKAEIVARWSVTPEGTYATLVIICVRGISGTFQPSYGFVAGNGNFSFLATYGYYELKVGPVNSEAGVLVQVSVSYTSDLADSDL